MVLESYINNQDLLFVMGLGRISTGSQLLDILLCGGYETDVVTTVYGPAGTGKTTLCLLALMNVIVNNAKKVVYIDTEGGFSVARLEQLADGSLRTVLENVLLFKPTTFAEQKHVFERLNELVDDRIGLIIVDSICMLYRLEMGKTDDITSLNRELGAQISYLTEITRKKNIPILLTNQVYNVFDDRDRTDKVNIVGGDILKYGSKCLLELQLLHRNRRRLILRKHRSLPEGREEVFEITNAGIGEPDVAVEKEDKEERTFS